MHMRLLSRALACALSACVILPSSSPEAWAAFVRSVPVRAGTQVGVAPVAFPALSIRPGLSQVSLGDTLSPGLPGVLPSVLPETLPSAARTSAVPEAADRLTGRRVMSVQAAAGRAQTLGAQTRTFSTPAVRSLGAPDAPRTAGRGIGQRVFQESGRSGDRRTRDRTSRSALETAAKEAAPAKGFSRRFAALGALFHGWTRRSEETSSPAAAPVLPESPVRASSGLNPHEFRLQAAAAQGVPSPAADGPDAPLSPEAKRGITGMFVSRAFSMVAFAIGAIAYPMLLVEAVGKAQMFSIFSLGGLIAIAINMIAGRAADHITSRWTLKKYIVFNTALRGVLSLMNAAFFAMGWLNLWTLLALTVVSAWQFSTLYITGPAMMTAMVGNNRYRLRALESFMGIAAIAVSVLSALFLGRYLVDTMGLTVTFLVVAVLLAIPSVILHYTLPEVQRRAEGTARSLRDSLGSVWSWLKGLPWRSYALSAAALAAGLALFFFGPTLTLPFIGTAAVHGSPLPMIAAMLFILLRTKIFRGVIWKHKLLLSSLVLVMLTAAAEIPLRNAVLGALAMETVGAAGRGAFLGGLLAAFYMGQMPTSTGIMDPSLDKTVGSIGPWKLKRPRTLNLRRVMKWAGAAGLALWVNGMLLPVGWPAAAAAAFGVPLAAPAWAAAVLGFQLASAAGTAFYLAVHSLSPKVPERGWMFIEAAALLGLGVPAFFWGSRAVLYLSLFIFGMLHRPTTNTIHANFTSQSDKHAKESMQYLMGIKGSFLSIATAITYAFYGLVMSLPERLGWGAAAFPFTWQVIAAVCALMAVVFVLGGVFIPFEKDPKKARPAS